MTAFDTIGLLLALVGLFSYVNYRWLKWHATIGTMFIALLFSLAVVGMHYAGVKVTTYAETMLLHIDFDDVLLHGMLSFFLFAGALHLDLLVLKDVRWPVALLSVLGTVISTVLIGGAAFLLCQLIGVELPLLHAMIFGALISPTDPIAVLAMLKKSHAPKSLEMKIAGESLFNDGIAVVIFSSLMLWDQSGAVSFGAFVGAFFHQAIGGVIFGLASGWFVHYLLKDVEDLYVEILITLALVTGGYTLALSLGVSGPIAMVIAGMMVGRIRSNDVGVPSRIYLHHFWEVIDELLNAVLFVLIGLEVCILPLHLSTLAIGLLAVFVVLGARVVSIWLPIQILPSRANFCRRELALLTWGGLRGGLAVAMALSLAPSFPLRDDMVLITYVVVVFSVMVQGMTFNQLSSRLLCLK